MNTPAAATCQDPGAPPAAVSAAEDGRGMIIGRMQELAESGIGCSACTGVCCTFTSNSMMITVTEARHIAGHLLDRSVALAQVVQRLRDAVSRYGLDRPVPMTGNRPLLRRRYTCPFYAGGRQGCELGVEIKPLGCLAFNPVRPGISDGGDCRSDQELLARAESLRSTAHASAGKFPCGSDKLPIPVAILRCLPPHV